MTKSIARRGSHTNSAINTKANIQIGDLNVVSDVIDIHPHVISSETDNFPLKPLGGTQSSWSVEHPPKYGERITAMAAGIAKASVV